MNVPILEPLFGDLKSIITSKVWIQFFTSLSGRWTDFTPTVTPQTGAFVNVTATGRYTQIGNTVFFSAVITETNIGTGSGNLFVTIPVSTNNSTICICSGIEGNVNNKTLTGLLVNGKLYIFYYDGTVPMASSLKLHLTGNYEVS